MSDASQNPQARGEHGRIYTLLAAALLVAFTIHNLAESRIKSPTCDEPPHIASGLSYVATGVFRGNLQHPPLLKELSGLSLLLGGIRWPRNEETEWFLRGDVPAGHQPDWAIGNKIIATNGADRTLFWGRLPFVVIASLLGALLFVWGRQLLGGVAALLAVFLYVTDATVLAHSYLATMDVGLAAFTTLLLAVLWQYVCAPTRVRLLGCGLALGGVLGVKFSGLLLVPVVAALLLAAAMWRVTPPAGAALPPRSRPGWRGWSRALVPFLVMCAIAALVVQALYFFSSDPFLYVKGARMVNADHYPSYRNYLAGALGYRFLTYFGFAYLVKEPLAGIVLAAAGLFILLRGRAVARLGKAFLLLPPAAFFVATTLLAKNIGIRYILPALVFAHLLGGLALATLLERRTPRARLAALMLGLWLLVSVAGICPDHLSYFNEAACLLRAPGQLGIDGGSRCGVLWLDDSNVDWGQGFKQLKAWLDRNAPDRSVRIVNTFGFPPEVYGIRHEWARLAELQGRPAPGLHAVSAHLVARLPAHPGASDWLRQLPPRAVVGHALYIYDVPE